MSKELKLYFKRCTEPVEAFHFEKTFDKIGLSSTFIFVDKLNCFKLTAKMICPNKKVFEDTKKAVVIVKFEKEEGSENKDK